MFAGWTLAARFAAPLVALGLLAAAFWGHGVRERRAGRAEVRAEWDAAKKIQRELDAAERARQAAAGAAAFAQFEALQAELQLRRPEVARGLREALSAPISCPAGTLADVRLPAAAVDRLRDAGADAGAAGAAAARAGR